MKKNNSNLDYLAELTEIPTPAFIHALPTEQLAQLRQYVEAVVTQDEAGLDKLFESMSMMMKFIPNFILHSLTPKYIEPAIAARITRKLSLKQSLGVCTGLPVDYIAETSVYMQPQKAADIFEGLKKSKADAVAEYMVINHPAKALDILEHSSDEMIKISAQYIDSMQIDENSLSDKRNLMFTKLKQIKR